MATKANANTAAATTAARIQPTLTAVSAAVPMPSRTPVRGSESLFPFKALTAIGMSFGITNRDAKSMQGPIGNANRKAKTTQTVNKLNADGTIVYKTQDVTAADGTVTKIPTNEPETETKTIVTAHFFAVDVDPKTDPDGAKCRVFRDQ